jgi:hypothetical protein
MLESISQARYTELEGVLGKLRNADRFLTFVYMLMDKDTDDVSDEVARKGTFRVRGDTYEVESVLDGEDSGGYGNAEYTGKVEYKIVDLEDKWNIWVSILLEIKISKMIVTTVRALYKWDGRQWKTELRKAGAEVRR